MSTRRTRVTTPKVSGGNALRRKIESKYRIYGKREWQDPKYWNISRSGSIPKQAYTMRGKKRVSIGISSFDQARSRHYYDYLKRSRPITRSRSPRAGVPMGSLGPDLIFSIRMDPIIAGILQSTPQGNKIYNLFEMRIKVFYRNIVQMINREYVGNPKPGGMGAKGYVPLGGTGYMRMMTRAFFSRQVPQNTGFPFILEASIPVKYANPLNEMSTHSVAHTGQKEYRVIDYASSGQFMKPKYGKVKLFDPRAQKHFYQKLMEDSITKSAEKFKYLVNSINRSVRKTVYGFNIMDLNGNLLRFDVDSFDVEPYEFALELARP